jgi:tetratricopeptide (TPR) repeat protein
MLNRLLAALFCAAAVLPAGAFTLESGAAKKPPAASDARKNPLQAKGDAYRNFLEASFHEQNGEFGEALALYLQALREDPEAAYPTLKAGEMYLYLGDATKAEEYLTKSLAASASYEAHLLLAHLYQSHEDKKLKAASSPAALKEKAVFHYRAAIALRLEPGDAQFELARLLLSQKKYDEAEAVASEMMQSASRHPAPYLLLAEIREAQGRDAEAEEFLKQALAKDEDSRDALLAAGVFYQSKGRCVEAIVHLEKLLAAAPFDMLTRERLGLCYAAEGRYRDAARILEPLAAIRPSYEAVFALAVSWQQLGDTDKALELWLRFMRRDPQNARARVQLASAYAMDGRTDEAMEQYELLEEALLKQARGSKAEGVKEALLEVLHRKGMLLLSLKRPAEAGEVFERALRLRRPAPEDLYVLAIHSWLNARDATRGLTVSVEALSIYPKSRPIRFAVAEIYAFDGKEQEAAAIAGGAAREEGSEDGDFATAAGLLFRLKRAGEAIALLEEGEKRFPESDRIQFELGAMREQQGDIPQAERHLKRAIELNPLHAPALNYLGYMWAERNMNLQEALDLILKAVSMDSKNGAYLDSLGWAHFRLGNFKEAEENLTKAIALQEDPVIREHLGDLYYAMGRTREAITQWQKAVDGKAPKADDIRRRMEEAEKRLGGKR